MPVLETYSTAKIRDNSDYTRKVSTIIEEVYSGPFGNVLYKACSNEANITCNIVGPTNLHDVG